MREQCIRATETALGRRITEAEARGIEDRIRNARLQAARADPAAYRAMTPDQQLAEAGRRAALELQAEKAKQVERAQTMILGHDRLANFRASQIAQGNDKNGLESMERVLRHNYDEKDGGFVDVESRANGGFNVAYTQMSEVFDRLNPGLWRRILDGQWSMEPMRRAFTDALHGVNGPNIPQPIRDMAKRYHDTVNELRERFNALGGVIGKLEDWGSSHNWSERLVRNYPGSAADQRKMVRMAATGNASGMRALHDQMTSNARRHFVDQMMQWADRRAYVKDDGTYFNDSELRDFFNEAWATIASDGWTKSDGTAPFPGGGVKANRGSHHRVIHLKPEAAYEALTQYSEQNILESMVGTLRRMNRDIALLETFGSNPDVQFETQVAKSIEEAVAIDPTQAQKLAAKADRLRNLFNHLAGNNPPPANRAVADAFATARNINVFKLASSALTSITDWATMYQGAIQHRLNPFKVALNSSLAWLPGSRRYARRMGLVVDTMIADLERMSAENVNARTLSAKTASGVIRLSGLSFVTNARKLGFSMTLMDSIGHLTREFADVSALDQNDRQLLAAKGIDQQTWDIWRAARLDSHGANHTLLTPDAIMRVQGPDFEARRNAAIKLMSIVNQEQDLAIIQPGAREQVMARTFFGVAKPGTIGGELARSMFLFKSFSIAFLGRQGERAAFYAGNEPTWASRGGRFAYMAKLVVAMTILGALRNWIMDVLSGKDPRPMNPMSPDARRAQIARKNWMQATLTGGGMGVFGDFLFAENSRGQSTFLETAGGPLLGSVGSVINLTTQNAEEAAMDEPTDAGAEALRFARSNAPFTGLPYIRGLADRYLWNELQEWADPGSVDRQVQRGMNLRDDQYWWSPTSHEPERAPDLGAGLE